MRGFAAVSVLAFHACGMSWDMITGGIAPVVVFFVLSGFLLARSLDHNSDLLIFVRHRLFRLLPAAIATVLLLTILFRSYGFHIGYLPSFDPLNVLLNALLIKSDINGVMWSLTVECVAIPIIFLSHNILKRFGRAPLWVLVIILLAASWYGPYVHLLGGFTNLAPLYAFVVGLLVQSSPPPQRLESRLATIISLVALAVLVIVAIRKQTAVTIAFETICASTLVYLSVHCPKKLPILMPLDLHLARFFGKISYSFYLLHFIGLSITARYLPLDLAPATQALLLFIGGLAFTTPMAWLMWKLIEVPFINLGRWRPATVRA